MINDAEHFLHAYLISTYLLWWSVYSYLLTFFKKLGCLCSLLNFEFFLFLHTSPLSGMLFENIFSQSVGYFSHSFSNIFCRANVFNLSILPNARSWRFSLIFPSRSFIVLYFTFQIANICWIIEKAREFQKNIYFCSIDYAKAFDCVDHKTGKFFKRWEYQTILPASWEICMQVKKQQLELNMGQWAGSKLGKECVKDIYCHPAYLTSMQSTSCEMLGCMKHRILILDAGIKIARRNIKNLSYTMTLLLWQKVKRK